jgi:hypothetical protein
MSRTRYLGSSYVCLTSSHTHNTETLAKTSSTVVSPTQKTSRQYSTVPFRLDIGGLGVIDSEHYTTPHCAASKPLLLFAGSQPPATMSLNQVVLNAFEKKGKEEFWLTNR